MGVQLNLAEKMRASTGPWQELAKLFVEDFPDVYALMKDRARSKDFQLTLSCFSQIVECMYPTAANGVPILKTNHTHLPKLLSNKGAVDDGLKSHLASVWNTFKDLIEADPDTFTNSNKYLRGVQTLAPVEMVAITALISMHSETRNNRLLLGDIQAMRTEVREHFVDLRLNTAVWKWFWEYIDNLEAIRGAIDGSTVNRKSKQRTKKNATSTDNAAAGSTAANITAAAAAPRKGRATARTKRSAATVVPVMEEPETSVLPGPPSLKRRRTGESPLDKLSMADDQFLSPAPNAAVTPAGLHQHQIYQGALLPPMPTHASTQSPRSVVQQPHPRANHAPSAPPSTVPSGQSVQSQTALPTPSEARQQRVAGLNNFQSAYQISPQVPPHGLPTDFGHGIQQPRAPTAPMLATTGSFMPDRNYSQMGGSMGLTESVARAAPLRSVPPTAHSVPEPRTSLPPTVQRADEGPIDLTSDTEQERQVLLSAFKTKPATTEPPKVSKPTATPTASRRTSTAKQPRVSSQDLPTRENNPYAKFKNK